jgi:hypothetical protein
MLKIEAKLLAEPQLQKVIIQAFLADTYFLSCILQ